jgi:hypothetical protein
VWRVLAQHHSWYSVGEHGGWSQWDDEQRTVKHIPNCDKDSNVVEWFVNTLDPQDPCAEKYRAFVDSLRSVIQSSGVKIHFTLSGHEHSLQLLSYEVRDSKTSYCPKIFVISGAGAKATKVKSPSPETGEFTAPQRSKNGESHSGFVQLKFDRERVRLVFFNSENGDSLDMGTGRKEFWIDKNGELIQ